MQLSTPSKTFLVGEYLALAGGPSLLLSTGPRFYFEIQAQTEGSCQGIHPESPAGRLIRDHSHQFSRFKTSFRDLHQARGGFGASGAQFLLTYVWSQIADHKLNQMTTAISVQKLWQSFRDYVQPEVGLAPSGADIISQFTGGVTCFRSKPFTVEKLDWTFPQKKFFILRTGQKVPTHQHLAELRDLPIEPLQVAAEATVSALKIGSWEKFLQGVKDYYQVLVDNELVCEFSQGLVSQLAQNPKVDAVKSCGALGADTLLVFLDAKNEQELRADITALGLELVTTQLDETGLALSTNFKDQENSQEEILMTPQNIGEIHV